MTEYWVPAAAAQGEFVEKRSRFIGHVWRVGDEKEARMRIEETRKKHYDATHNCWCYLLREGGILRYSDDGEPQGTAGLPMLEVFRREEITNVCCVATRYFGGILLGAGGLCRAYQRCAKDALLAAQARRICLFTRWKVPCSYPLFERMKLELAACGGMLEGVEYGAEIELRVAFPAGAAERFLPRLTELSAGSLTATALGEAYLAEETATEIDQRERR